MPDLTAKRTLVKSPPELWEELSEVEGLTKHFGAFGEIKITKLEPEHTVAWEGEHGSGTVSIEPSGWGTKVTLHAELPETPEATTTEPDEPEATTTEPDGPEATTTEPAEREPTDDPAPVAPKPGLRPEAAEPEPIVAESEQSGDESGSDVAKPELDEEPVLVETVSLPEHEPKRRGFWAWLFRTRTAPPEPRPSPVTTEPDGKPAVAAQEPVVTEATSAVAEAATAVPEPVADEAEPVLEEAEPVVEEAEPVVEEAEPVVDEAQPVEDEAEANVAEGDRDLVTGAVENGCEPEDSRLDPERARVVLDEALDALGAAHHRPFSRG